MARVSVSDLITRSIAVAGVAPTALPTTAIPIGDSLTARAVSSTDLESFSGVGHMTWVQMLTHERLRLVRNAGIAGQGTADILARIDADVIAYAPGYCIYLCGINDLNPARAGGPLTAAQIEPNITAALDKLRNAGIFTFILTVPPATFINTTSAKTEIAKLNAWIRGLSRTRKGLRVVDVFPLVASSANLYASGTLAWVSGLDADGTHPSSKGAKVIGQAIADQINLLVPRTSPLPGNSADPFELIPNPLMIGNTSGLATNVQRTATVGALGTVTKVVRTDGIQGEWQQVVVAASASNRILQNATGGSFADGDVVIATVEVDEDPSANWTDTHGLTVQALDAPGTTILGSRTVNFLGTEHAPTGSVLRTPPFTIPAGTAAGTLRMYYQVTATAGGPVTARVGRMSLRKVGT